MSTGRGEGIVHLHLFIQFFLKISSLSSFLKISVHFFFSFILKSTLLSHNQLFFHWPCVQVHRKHYLQLMVHTPLMSSS